MSEVPLYTTRPDPVRLPRRNFRIRFSKLGLFRGVASSNLRHTSILRSELGQREFFVDNLLVQIHNTIVMI